MKKNILPLLLIAGAAIAFMAFRRRPRVTVEAGPTERITEQDFAAPIDMPPARQTALDIGTKLVSNLFTKQPGAKARATAVKRAVRTKTATRAQAKAVTRQLAKGIRVAGFGDNVLV
jgi:hypothetical protein